MTTKLLLCSCAGTQQPDKAAIASATGLACSRVHTELCGQEAGVVAEALSAGETIVACGQETAFFETLAEDAGAERPLMVDIRDRAGWSADKADKTPKTAALLALARLGPAPEKTMDVVSEGICLVLGRAAVALPAAETLADALSVTCVTTDAPDLTPSGTRRFDAHQGRIRSATGSLGRFEVVFDGFSAAAPPGRGALALAAPRDRARSSCDVILDLTGGAPLFPAHEKRDGYLRADPGDPNAVWRAIFAASQLVGTFEKTLHVALEATLCAHSRAGQEACRRCLDLCPTGAITPDGEHVSIDPAICAGCGACAAACPAEAITADAPPSAHVFAQLSAAGRASQAAGGERARLLVHDPQHGGEMIALSARLGRGLPADVIPLETPALAGFGHAEIMVAIASGFASVDILVGPKADRAAIEAQVALAGAMLDGLGRGAGRVRMIEPVDPDALSDLLFDAATSASATAIEVPTILALGGRRDATRLAASALAVEADMTIPLPDGAPYGAVVVDGDACTLCLACAGLCPSGALRDHPDMPMLKFNEKACLQCNLCVSVCPEDAISLRPQLDLSNAALGETVMKEEEPYPCIECGALFGVKSTVERIVAKLEDAHPMFLGSDKARLIRMCDDCRVKAQYHEEAVPFFMGHRPRPRTAEDLQD